MSDPDAPRLPPRLAPDVTFPPYSYVTGRFPHPTRDPSGHSFGHAAPAPGPVDPARWHESRAYLMGCDLFNYGYYWEAHEVWEGLWQATGRTGPTADFLKGLIKLAAAGVKCREGRADGVRRHTARAAELFQRVQDQAGTSRYLGIDLPWLRSTSRQLARQPPAMPTQPMPVEVVFGFGLLPGEVPAT
jgi:predicted metal-dependent hydrolase